VQLEEYIVFKHAKYFMSRFLSVALVAILSLFVSHQSFAEKDGMPEEKARLGQSVEVVSLAFSPNGKQLSVLNNDGRWRVWDMADDGVFYDERSILLPVVENGRKVNEGRSLIPISASPALKTYWNSANEAVAVSEGIDNEDRSQVDARRGKVWRFGAEKPILTFKFSRDFNAPDVDVSPEKDKAVVTTGQFYHAGMELIDLMTGKTIRDFKEVDKGGATDASYGAIFSPDGQTVSAVVEEGVGLWNVKTGERERIFPNSLKPFAFSPDGRNILIATKNYETIECRSVSDGTLISSMPLPLKPSSVRAVIGFPPSNLYNVIFLSPSLCFVFTPDRKTKIWNINKQSNNWWESDFQSTSPGVVAVALSPDKKRLATGHPDGTVTLWDVSAVPAN